MMWHTLREMEADRRAQWAEERAYREQEKAQERAYREQQKTQSEGMLRIMGHLGEAMESLVKSQQRPNQLHEPGQVDRRSGSNLQESESDENMFLGGHQVFNLNLQHGCFGNRQ